ncbi:OmpA family protein [Shewanella canadensis]|uniref:OmpA family protein n=1 Tax=Shewanella canadensis TaxID=271096 RepID=A0A3S0KUY3_9GAMM|nr:OmpA family protein [Shewanella canadensis]RTR38285.1 OmpA family protein [Shewanella canadensis]
MKISAHIKLYSLSFFLLISNIATASSTRYQTPLEQAKWDFTGSRFICQIEHKVNGFGEFKLIARPGTPLSLQLDADWLSFEQTTSLAKVVSPSWSQTDSLSSGSTHLKWHGRTASSDDTTSKFLEALEQGLAWQALVLAHDDISYKVETSPINTQAIANKFKLCRQELLPKPFSYVRRVDIQFESGTSKLIAAHEVDLEAIAQYVQADASVTEILVDAHADASGEHLANLVLSKERADEVASRLFELGIQKQKIQVRHHGSRSPRVSNNSPEGRELNRRVTIRLIKSHTKTANNNPTGVNNASL